jgi:hypothetical protein
VKIFTAMPISKPIAGLKDAILLAAQRTGFNCVFPDELEQNGKISSDIIDAIRSSSAVIVEITDGNPNVIWEYGFACAIGKRIIPITQSTESLFFDAKDIRTIVYRSTEIATKFVQELTLWLLEIKREKGAFSPVHLAHTKQYPNSTAVLGVSTVTGFEFGIFDLLKLAKKRVLMAGQNHWFVVDMIEEFKNALLIYFNADQDRKFDVLMCDDRSDYAIKTWQAVTAIEYEKHLKKSTRVFAALAKWARAQPTIGNRLRIRRVPFVPVSIDFVDPEEGDGFLVMTPNSFQKEFRKRPILVISRLDSQEIFGHYWSAYSNQFELNIK